MGAILPFPEPSLLANTARLHQLLRDVKERPWRFRSPWQRKLKPEGNKTESIYRWLRVGPPKTIHEMAYALQITYPAVKAIMNDLRRRGARIVATKTKRRGRVYKMKHGPRTYAALKQQRKTQRKRARITAPA